MLEPAKQRSFAVFISYDGFGDGTWFQHVYGSVSHHVEVLLFQNSMSRPELRSHTLLLSVLHGSNKVAPLKIEEVSKEVQNSLLQLTGITEVQGIPVIVLPPVNVFLLGHSSKLEVTYNLELSRITTRDTQD